MQLVRDYTRALLDRHVKGSAAPLLDQPAANPDEVEFAVNTEFFEMSLDAQAITARIMLVDRAIIAKADLQDDLRKSGIVAADRTNEMINDEAEDSLGLNLDG